jgi:hypothetical protein
VIRTTKSASFEGSSTRAGGTISLEQSPDGVKWTSVTAKVALNEDGAYKVAVRGLKAGTWQIRAKLAQTDTATEASSQPVTVLVEDYKVAGAKYLAIIKPYNDAIVAMNRAVDAANDNTPRANVRALRAADPAMSAAATKAAKQLRAYTGWPQSIAWAAESLAASMVLEADAYNLMSKATTAEERRFN